MSKKSFEVTRKITVSVKDLQDTFLWSLPVGERLDAKQLKPFYVSYDWDKILNSAAFKKSATGYLTTYSFVERDQIVHYFYANNNAVFDKIRAAYNKYRDSVVAVEKVFTRTITLVGREPDINAVFDFIAEQNDVVITNVEE